MLRCVHEYISGGEGRGDAGPGAAVCAAAGRAACWIIFCKMEWGCALLGCVHEYISGEGGGRGGGAGAGAAV